MNRRTFLAVCAAALVPGCASTSIVNQWQSPDPGPAFTKLLVVGVSRSASVRRVFEDEMVKALQARGVTAIPSYTLIPEDGPVSDTRLAEAVQKSGVDGVLTTRVLQVAQQVQVVGPGPTFWGPPWGFYSWYWGAWGPVYTYSPQVLTSDIVYAEVRLFRAKPDTLVWAATTESFAPRDVRRESADFARIVIGQLAELKLI